MATVFAAPGNNVSTTVGSAYTAGDGHLNLATGTGSKFPTLSGGQYYRVTVCQVAFAYSPTATTSNYTIYKATGISTDQLTGLSVISTGLDATGNTDRNYAVGDIVEVRVTAGTLGDIHTAVNNIETGATFLPLVSGSAVMGSTFSITAALGTFQDTSFSISLPAAGTYLVFYDVRISIQMASSTTDGFISVRLFQTDTSSVVPNSIRLCYVWPTPLTDQAQIHSSYCAPVTVNSACTVHLYAMRNSTSGTFTLSQVNSDNNGYTTFSYLRIA